mmetsp:Transcript_49650/g.106391  ORF Transcript_49650/g.106391 Transcript_49650/m.106391 type:complete len:576 (+) Transcript_49650:64-1791(+)
MPPNQIWEVVGGSDAGGVLVRTGEKLSSSAVEERLATGSFVEELMLKGGRLHYKLCQGKGPAEGWVSLRMKDTDLLVKGRLSLATLLLRPDPARPFSLSYEFDEQEPLAFGAFATVFSAKSRASGEPRAVKRMMQSARPRPKELEAVETELQLLVTLDHPHIMKFYEFFREPAAIYLVTELVPGGTFGDFFDSESWAMEEAQYLFHDVVSAVAYCHAIGVVHRDLKCDNCLVQLDGIRPAAKIIDFGVSAIRHRCDRAENWLNEVTGTPFYRAPEVIAWDRSYGPKADLWSIGVMLYLSLSSEHPFHSGSFHNAPMAAEETIKVLSTVRMDPLREASVPQDACDLICKLLDVDEGSRIDAHQALEQRWLQVQEVSLPPTPQAKPRSLPEVLSQAAHFRSSLRFQRAILRLVAHYSHEQDVAGLQQRFEALDVNQNGFLSKQELQSAIADGGFDMPDSDFESVFRAVDADGDGHVSFTEWLSATIRPSTIVSEQVEKEVFAFFDQDKSGTISRVELEQVLGKEFAASMLQTCDRSGDGIISWSEFTDLMRRIAADIRNSVSRSTRMEQGPDAKIGG